MRSSTEVKLGESLKVSCDGDDIIISNENEISIPGDLVDDLLAAISFLNS